ncbi:4-hydroxyphenylpyruvate dioxygenase [Microcoleus sp. FACHB-1515]|uniref:4-hydroxyphenylpyruvate dioxygenase n=1 Tax=Cyanophyceae TaxID=3028117 RepID=UPI001685DB17|nr:4-hydroxyphenylpyruvate dioxygenase [Microcoleus sp. FACHB-1515]MBD2091785.1 4-hydroxyphenylpyruvate dioxygenase [Microcoleus sp. FACHB-1515]
MYIDHVHFYVEDAKAWRDWFVSIFGFSPIASGLSADTHSEVVGIGRICIVLSAARTEQSAIAQYLRQHPPGVVNIALRVPQLEPVLAQAIAAGMPLLQSIQTRSQQRWAIVGGWESLQHTLIEGDGLAAALAHLGSERSIEFAPVPPSQHSPFLGVDHVVLNVAAGELERAVAWYEAGLGLCRQQVFAIHTDRSALCSQVLKHPQGSVQMPINEPASSSSQIQEFLDHNRGAGIQHIAIATANVVESIARLRQRGLAFLPVPQTYYDELPQRSGFQLLAAQWQAIAREQVLVDWPSDRPEAMLLQAFTQPIFSQPTFFFELIERQRYQVNQRTHQAEGFGEGNFRALFEAIEREQLKRGSLQ